MVVAVVGILGLVGTPVAAQPAGVSELVGQLAQERVVRLPGATVTVDEGRVEADLPPQDRVLIAPWSGLDAYGPDSLAALSDWATSAGVRLTIVEGLWIARLSGGAVELLFEDADKSARRAFVEYGDATNLVLGTVEEEAAPARASAAQLDQVAVSADRPGTRVATAPVGLPHVDYASGLAERFPGELVAVAHGGWLEFAGPGHDRASYLRFATHNDLLAKRGDVDLVDAVLDRVAVSPRPEIELTEQPHLTDWTATVSRAAPLAAGGAGVVGWLVLLLVRRVRGKRAEAQAMRLARAEAYTRIEELSARLLKSEDAGPGADERYATARTLFGQARTADAMAEVARIADEGFELAGGGS